MFLKSQRIGADGFGQQSKETSYGLKELGGEYAV